MYLDGIYLEVSPTLLEKIPIPGAFDFEMKMNLKLKFIENVTENKINFVYTTNAAFQKVCVFFRI
jgi:hypothetical protein